MTLPDPIKNCLREPVDQATLDRVWRKIDDDSRRPEPSHLRLSIAISVSLLCLCLVLIMAGTGGSDGGRVPGAGDRHRESLQALDNAAIRPMFHDKHAPAPRTFVMNDGSRIELAPGARIVPNYNSERDFSLHLLAGRVTFDVKPFGSRLWMIETTLGTVEVVGTRFAVEKAPRLLRVEVEKGVVRVRSHLLSTGNQLLDAGQVLELKEKSPETRPVERAEDKPVRAQRAPGFCPSGSSEHLHRNGVIQTNPQPARPISTASLKPALSDPGDDGASARPAQSFLEMADAARRSGRPHQAARLLRLVIDHHANTHHAAIAAFVLGKIQSDSLGTPQLAAESFALAIAIGLPAALEEDAYARLIQARIQAGDPGGARAASQEYEIKHPQGWYRDQVWNWVQP